jgi:hypothetical protein
VPVKWRIEGVVLLESDAEATFEEWVAALHEAFNDDAFRRGMGVVHDTRQLTRLLHSNEVSRRIAFVAQWMAKTGATRWAVVVPGRGVEYGMARMGEAFADHEAVAFRVFQDDLAEAIAWARG